MAQFKTESIETLVDLVIAKAIVVYKESVNVEASPKDFGDLLKESIEDDIKDFINTRDYWNHRNWA